MTFLKKISFLDSSNYSPWPMRLLGIKPWQKTERNTKEVLDEYNNVWYKNALQEWENYLQSEEFISPIRFFRKLDQAINQQMMDNFEVYGVSRDEHLISIQGELYTACWSVINSLYNNLLTEQLGYYSNLYGCKTLIELGCGTGKNLFNAYYNLPINKIVGAEICSNAVTLGNKIASQCQINGNFKQFDYFNPNDIVNLTADLQGKYIIFTSHSIEQVQVKNTTLIDQIINLENPPEVVLHFEPILNDGDPSLFNQLHSLYCKKNLYNSDLIQELQNYENDNLIQILEYKPTVFGLSAFNPTSILAWKVNK